MRRNADCRHWEPGTKSESRIFFRKRKCHDASWRLFATNNNKKPKKSHTSNQYILDALLQPSYNQINKQTKKIQETAQIYGVQLIDQSSNTGPVRQANIIILRKSLPPRETTGIDYAILRNLSTLRKLRLMFWFDFNPYWTPFYFKHCEIQRAKNLLHSKGIEVFH